MPVTINGTTGISGVDGSVSTPALQGSDTNTGVYFPAADTVAIAAGGTEAFRATSGGNLSLTGTMAMGSSFLRNKIINGAMMIDQRNAGASFTVIANAYTLDRWIAICAGVASKFSVQQVASGAGFLSNGFGQYMQCTSLSAYTLLSSDKFTMSQYFEGFNVVDLAFGTSSAKSVTVSFWVQSSLTGTFGGSLQNFAGTRSYPFTYTISSANTWEYKTVTIPGDTGGTWVGATNAGAMILNFGLGVGTTASGTAGSWASADYRSATGAVSVVSTNAATWLLSGVQLEAGTQATPFERRLYGQELALCQRYYEVGGPYNIWSGDSTSGSTYYHSVRYAVTKRATPNVVTTDGGNARFAAGAPAVVSSYTDILQAYKTANATGGSAYFAYSWTSSSEL